MKIIARLMSVCAAAALGAWAAHPTATLHTTEVMKTQDLFTFAGTVTAIDAAKYTLTINGHEVLATVHQKTLTHDTTTTTTAKKKPAAKETKDAQHHFVVDPGCRVVGADKIPMKFADLATNSVVTARYSTTKDFDRKTVSTIAEITVTKSK